MANCSEDHKSAQASWKLKGEAASENAVRKDFSVKRGEKLDYAQLSLDLNQVPPELEPEVGEDGKVITTIENAKKIANKLKACTGFSAKDIDDPDADKREIVFFMGTVQRGPSLKDPTWATYLKASAPPAGGKSTKPSERAEDPCECTVL
eukprot:gnl/TRDRNA2_/TRDRNA2_204195_c0_seq1.p1 gnl/TRDRNA2_/TRDRNA2_204195_c0~~gnl/TRDRNA2_/TRDRNA2_204195_c0_seq1.p1  ORF type:complete len:150 (-),score=32.96 gnl/TRDRNA2_/TRDRNA2_204195_c0_seq1:31-480(-)